jgi:hypothetical protein
MSACQQSSSRRSRIAGFVFGCVLVSGACQRSAPIGDFGASPDARNAGDASDAVPKCFKTGKFFRCDTGNACGDFHTCQHGVCCSGELDPETCVCHCAGGTPCFPAVCCTGDPNAFPVPSDVGTLKCRVADECRPRRH